MEIPCGEVFRILKSKGVHFIYHANSVVTACQFLRDGSLISRGVMEQRQLYQTPQKSDPKDKTFGLWFDVFADTVDIHRRMGGKSDYGPVLFVIDCEILRSTKSGNIWVTKSNPIYWSETTQMSRWFTSVNDLEENLSVGSFGQSIVFRHCNGEMPLVDHLQKVIVDDPQMKDGESDLFEVAFNALSLAVKEQPKLAAIEKLIEKRHCDPGCKCVKRYAMNLDASRTMFCPRQLD